MLQQQVDPEANKTNIKKIKPKEERKIGQDPKTYLLQKGLGRNTGKREDEGRKGGEEKKKNKKKIEKNYKNKKRASKKQHIKKKDFEEMGFGREKVTNLWMCRENGVFG